MIQTEWSLPTPEVLCAKPFYPRLIKQSKKDHTCSFCHATIPKGSPYYDSNRREPRQYLPIKICLACMNKNP